MVINEKNINIFGAELIERDFTNHEIVNINDWIDGASSPVFLREYTRYKAIDIKVTFSGANTQEILFNIDKFIAEIKVSTVKFNDLDYFYDTHMEGTASMERVNKGSYIVSLSLLAHKTYKAETSLVFTGTDPAVLNIEGTMETPLYIEITPSENIEDFSITGVSKNSIELKNLEVGHTYTIDGYTIRYLKDGANDIQNYDSFEFPVGKAGVNNILLSSAAANVKIFWYPRYH